MMPPSAALPLGALPLSLPPPPFPALPAGPGAQKSPREQGLSEVRLGGIEPPTCGLKGGIRRVVGCLGIG
jgi:hypothetical protein